MARCCRSCTSTATRSPTHACSRASATRNWSSFSAATATRRFLSKADEPAKMHQLMAAALDQALDEIQRIQSDARATTAVVERPRWPMIILRSPKGWTCPKEIDGKRAEDSWRSHQVPMGEMHEKPEHIKILEQWMKSYRPRGTLRRERPLQARARRTRAQRRAPHERQSARQRRHCCCAICACPTSATTPSK